jgi:hypothetical protein
LAWMFLHVSCSTSQQNPYIGGFVVAGLLKLKGAAFDTPFSDTVETTMQGLSSILLKSTSVISVMVDITGSGNKSQAVT